MDVREAPPSAFGIHNVRVFMLGQGLSNIGSFFQIVALSLLVLDQTGSGLALGAIMGVQAIPMLLFGPWAGVLIDRIRIRHLLIVTSLVGSLQAIVLAVISGLGDVPLGVIVALSFAVGFVQIFERPAATAFIPELVPRELVSSAVGINSAVQSIGRLGGPAIAAALFAWQGPAFCFAFNAISYLAVVGAVLALRKRDLLERDVQPRERGQLRAGLAYVRASPTLGPLLLANAVIGCLTFNYPLFYSSLTKFTFDTGPWAFGWAESLNAVTAVIGGILLARRYRPETLMMYAVGCLALGSSLAWSALSPNVWVFLVGMLYFGFVVVLYQITAQALVQLNSPYELKGRMQSLFTLGLMGTTPIGGVIAGVLIDQVSPRAALALGALGPFLCGLAIMALPAARMRAVPQPVEEPA